MCTVSPSLLFTVTMWVTFQWMSSYHSLPSFFGGGVRGVGGVSFSLEFTVSGRLAGQQVYTASPLPPTSSTGVTPGSYIGARIQTQVLVMYLANTPEPPPQCV